VSRARAYRLAAAVAVLAVALGCDGGGGKTNSDTGADAAAQLSVEARAWQLIDNGALLLDVRSPGEYAAGHLPGAVNVPFNEVERHKEKLGGDTDREIVVYCAVGARASAAQRTLARMGYKRVFNAKSFQRMMETRGASP